MADYGRLFDGLSTDPEKMPDPHELGGRAGPMNGREYPYGSQKNESIPAGYSAFAQFVTHDVTWTQPSTLCGEIKVSDLTNRRDPQLTLDSVYGDGVKREDGNKLAVTRVDGRVIDLPRDDSRAAIPDRRNDSNLIISQLHLAFLNFHNRLADSRGYDEAALLVTNHYQWLVLHDYLPTICGDALDVEQLIQSRDLELYNWKSDQEPFVPVEFSHAVNRFGHSAVKQGYRINREYWLYIVSEDERDADLVPDPPLDEKFKVDWSYFFPVGTDRNQLQDSNLIDSWISDKLLLLPERVLREDFGGERCLRSLVTRDFLRAQNLRLPSGQQVAEEMHSRKLLEGSDVLVDREIWQHAPQFRGKEAPLLYYVLQEAAVKYGGRHLGKVGARIVAETLIGLLSRDSDSILNSRWRLGDGLEQITSVPALLRYAEENPT